MDSQAEYSIGYQRVSPNWSLQISQTPILSSVTFISTNILSSRPSNIDVDIRNGLENAFLGSYF